MHSDLHSISPWVRSTSSLAYRLTWAFLLSLAMLVTVAPRAYAQGSHNNIGVDTEPQLQANDFAYGMQLEPTPGHALQTFVLPREVLEHLSVERAELSVFNRGGDRVPHAVRQLRSSGDERKREGSVPFFPLYPARNARPGAPSSVQVQVQRTEDGRLVRVEVDDNADKATDADPREVVAYLLDTTQLGPIERLRFQLTDHEPTFVWPLAVETSSDLTHFSPTSVRGSLVSLRHGEHHVQSQHLALSGLTANYLRLSWSTAAPPAMIESVSAELVPELTTPPLPTHHVQGAPDPARPNDWLFDLGAALPIAKLELVMSESNTVIAAEIEARPGVDVPFSPLYRGTFYRLEHAGTEVQSAAVAITPRHQRYIRVRIAPRGGGLGSGGIALRAHVIPEQLLFVARGEGPFSLAFGRFGASVSAFNDAELLNLVGSAAGDLPPSSVAAGPVVKVGGAAVLRPPTPEKNHAKLVLWGVLGAAVLLLAGLSYMLFRRLNNPESPT